MPDRDPSPHPAPGGAGSLLLRGVRPRAADGSVPDRPVDLRIEDGTVTALGPALRRRRGEEVADGHGALLVPGLWDQHVHAGQVAQGPARLDTTHAADLADLLGRVRGALAARPAAPEAEGPEALIGFGHRLVDLGGDPTVAALDAVTGDTPVVLIGGDAHHAWMNTPALRALGTAPRAGIVAEDAWFDLMPRLELLPGVARNLRTGLDRMQTEALSRGVVGLVDMEWGRSWETWQRHGARLRVRAATYASTLEDAPAPSGLPLSPGGLLTMGPLKVIVDGSLGSRSAWCRHPYPGADGTPGHGVLTVDRERLGALLLTARERGLWAAVHAIGDAAVALALDALTAVGLPGRIEHAQLLADEDVARWARAGVTASVQPAHLLDDRDTTEGLWPQDAAHSFRLRDLVDAGVPLALGSDAPVAPIDPWLAMAAAVHRSGDDRPAWYPAQQLQPAEALAASTDGVLAVGVGGPGDLVLLEGDPFAPVPRGADGRPDEGAAREAAARLRGTRPLATVVAGRLAHSR